MWLVDLSNLSKPENKLKQSEIDFCPSHYDVRVLFWTSLPLVLDLHQYPSCTFVTVADTTRDVEEEEDNHVEKTP